MKNKHHILLSITSTALLVGAVACGRATPAATPAPTLRPGSDQRTLTVDGLERSFVLHVPAGINPAQPVPLVFVFHGFQENGNSIRMQSGLDRVADANGFLVAYPDGTGPRSGLGWNAGGCCGEALANNVDDEAFVRAMIADIGTVATLDLNRVYAAGFSNGALLSFRLACDMSDVFAAVAPVAGVLVTDPCRPGEPVSIIQIHGMDDTAVPYDGGQNPAAAVRFRPVLESLSVWVQLDGCTASPQVEQEGIVTHTAYTDCALGVSVELYTLDGMGHSWPSQFVTTPSMTDVIWTFFAAHPKP